MKKNYISPVSETVEVKTEAVLVSGTNGIKVTGKTSSGQPSLDDGGDTEEGKTYAPW